MRTFLFPFCLILFLLSLHSGCPAQSRQEYSDYLFSDGDYFRAISQYKEICFFSGDREEKNYCMLQISKALFKSNRFRESIRYLGRLLDTRDISAEYRSAADIYLGLNYYAMGTLVMANDFFKRAAAADSSGFAPFYLSLLEVEKGNWKEAARGYERISKEHQGTPIGEISKQLSMDVLEGAALKTKNPLAATVLSALLPGSGQVYAGHYYDGAQAFVYVGSFAFATFSMYRYNDKISRNYTATAVSAAITAFFYLGNLIGANRTVDYYNMRQKEIFMLKIKEKTFSVVY